MLPLFRGLARLARVLHLSRHRQQPRRVYYQPVLEQLENRITPSGSNLSILATFNGPNGAYPNALTMDSAGNLYGTTVAGGSDYVDGNNSGSGTLFKLAQGSDAITTIATSNGSNFSGELSGNLVMDSSGNLYGIAAETRRLYEFAPGSNTITTRATDFALGIPPYGLVMDSSGNLYASGAGGNGVRIVIAELPQGSNTFTTLVDEASITPGDGLIVDANGNLYGTTSFYDYSTTSDYRNGTIYELVKGSNSITNLAVFDGTNGSGPIGGLIMDSNGNLYGTTSGGGMFNDGTVFELPKGSGTITTLASFNGTNGFNPTTALVMDSSGDLYGTTSEGGPSYNGSTDLGDGTVFEVVKGSGLITTLASFNGTNGSDPESDLIMDDGGNLYGTTSSGGADGYGTVFEVSANQRQPSLSWDTTQGGVDFSYKVTGEATPSDTHIALYWSSSDQFADIIGGPVYSQDIPAGTAAGSYGPYNVSATTLESLGPPPQNATYLLAVTDPNNVLGDFDSNQNVAAVAYDPEITVKAKYDGQPSEGEMGRYFQNLPGTSVLADNYYTVNLSPSLAALRPDVDVKIGGQDLTASPSANDPTVYTTNTFDPGSLPAGDTPLLGEALIDGQDVQDDSSTILVEPLPSWFTSLQGAKLSFDPNAAGANGDGAYVLSGNLPGLLLGGSFFTIPSSVPLIGGQIVSGGVGFSLQVVAPLAAQSSPALEVGLNAQVMLGQQVLFTTSIPASLPFANGAITLTVAPGTALDPLTLEEAGGFSATIGLDIKTPLSSVTLAQTSELVDAFGIPVELQGSVALGGSLDLKADAQIVYTTNSGFELNPTGTDLGIGLSPSLTGTLQAGWFAPAWITNLLKRLYPSAFKSGETPGLYLQDMVTLTGTIEADQHFGGPFSSVTSSDLVFTGSLDLSDQLKLLAETGNTTLFDITLLNAKKHLYDWKALAPRNR